MQFLISEENKNKSGIYKIKNIINNKFYIGSTRDFKKRFNEHNKNLKKNKGAPYIQNEYNKYQTDSFIFEIIELTENDKTILIETEQKYLDLYYDNQNNCLNINNLANSRLGSKNN